MSYIYHGKTDWIKQPNRVVQTFRSGLCMIQQQYIRRADDQIDYFAFREGDAIPMDDSAPCIDGAYIFPAPSYEDMGNGFISCTVTAYGRVNTTGAVDLSKRLGPYLVRTFNVNTGALFESYNNTRFFDVATYRFAARKSEFVTAPDTPQLYIYDEDGARLAIGVFGQFVRQLYRRTESYESTSYGEFLEVIISVTAAGFEQTTIGLQ